MAAIAGVLRDCRASDETDESLLSASTYWAAVSAQNVNKKGGGDAAHTIGSQSAAAARQQQQQQQPDAFRRGSDTAAVGLGAVHSSLLLDVPGVLAVPSSASPTSSSTVSSHSSSSKQRRHQQWRHQQQQQHKTLSWIGASPTSSNHHLLHLHHLHHHLHHDSPPPAPGPQPSRGIRILSRPKSTIFTPSPPPADPPAPATASLRSSLLLGVQQVLSLPSSSSKQTSTTAATSTATTTTTSSSAGKSHSLLRAKSTGALRAFLGLSTSDAHPPNLPQQPPTSNTASRSVSTGSSWPLAKKSPDSPKNSRSVNKKPLLRVLVPTHRLSSPPRLNVCTSPISKGSFQTAVMAALPLGANSSMLHHDESDISSVISLGDRPVLSSDEDDDRHLHDTQKYRLPESKSRGSSRNGFILEDGSAVERQPPTPPKDDNGRPGLDTRFSLDDLSPEDAPASGYFNPYGLVRTNSVYTLSRASFSNQLSQLTSIKLPQANFLASSISSIPTSAGAARALNDAADQIRIWITKATEVLDGLDAEDDVEWAAAGGRDGLGEVDAAINRFESLINVYVTAIENLEKRADIDNLSGADLTAVVSRMERILQDWSKIKESLEGVKQQVEMAMQWEEMWNSVLGEIGMEEEQLGRLIFEMEEQRHKNSLLDSLAEPGQGLDIKELETIVEEAPVPPEPTATNKNGAPQKAASQDDSNLLALFAKLQPLRAALDFLPMRLSEFFDAARSIFPTACEELERRVEVLEAKYKKLESDAESLRKELGEDRWVLIFRKAGRQALKMCESVERSVFKLREALEEGSQHTAPAATAKKMENYEAKKEHYGPAIQQVLAIIDRGVATRLTVNGEILRLQADMQRRWAELETLLKGMDFALEQLNVSRGGTGNLRDSISTILSEQRSVASSTGTLVDTPGSSPASSVVLLGRYSNTVDTPRSKSRQGSFASSNATARSTKRLSSLPAPALKGTNKTLSARSSSSNLRTSVAGVSSRLYPGPPPRSVSRQDDRPAATAGNGKPKWNGSTNLRDTTIGHNFAPLSTTEQSPYRKELPPSGLRSPRSYAALSVSMSSGIPSPLGKPNVVNTPKRPGSSMALRSNTHSGIPHLTPSIAKTQPVTPARSALPRVTSVYGTPAQATALRAGLKSPPPSAIPSSRKHLPSSSVTSVASSNGSTQGTLRGFTAITPSSAAASPSAASPSAASEAQSPLGASTSTRFSRPGTAMSGGTTGVVNAGAGSNRRLSMLPQPKRLSSASSTTASAAAAVAMASKIPAAGTTPQPNRTLSRAGSRMALNSSTSGARNDGPMKPKWR